MHTSRFLPLLLFIAVITVSFSSAHHIHNGSKGAIFKWNKIYSEELPHSNSWQLVSINTDLIKSSNNFDHHQHAPTNPLVCPDLTFYNNPESTKIRFQIVDSLGNVSYYTTKQLQIKIYSDDLTFEKEPVLRDGFYEISLDEHRGKTSAITFKIMDPFQFVFKTITYETFSNN